MTATIQRERQALLRRVEGRTLLDVFLATADLRGPHPALVAKEGDAFRTRSWADYRTAALELAAGLREAAGIGTGDRVAVAVGNRPEHAIADIALLLTGAVPVPVAPDTPADVLRAVVASCPVTHVITDDAATTQRWAQAAPQVTAIIATGDGGGRTTLASLAGAGHDLLRQAPRRLEGLRAQVGPDDPAVIVVTDGPDGTPAPYAVTHRNLLVQLAGLDHRLQLEFGLRTAAYLPLTDIGARVCGHYLPLRFGGSVAFVQEPWQLLEVLLEHRPQLLFSPPQLWGGIRALVLAGIDAEEDERRRKVARKAVEVGERAGRQLVAGGKRSAGLRAQHRAVDRVVFTKMRDRLGIDAVRWAIVAGAPVSVELAAFYRGLGIELQEAWVRPEAGGVVAVNPTGACHLGTVGEALPGTEVRVSRDGEVTVRGPQLSPDAATDEQGWWHTGELGTADRGYLQHLGPAADVLRTADGTRIVPLRAEQQIVEGSPIVGHVCVTAPGEAMIALDADLLPLWCMQQGIAFSSLEDAAANLRILGEVQRTVDEANHNLDPAEQIRRWRVSPTAWSPQTGELDTYLRVRRPAVRASEDGT